MKATKILINAIMDANNITDEDKLLALSEIDALNKRRALAHTNYTEPYNILASLFRWSKGDLCVEFWIDIHESLVEYARG